MSVYWHNALAESPKPFIRDAQGKLVKNYVTVLFETDDEEDPTKKYYSMSIDRHDGTDWVNIHKVDNNVKILCWIENPELPISEEQLNGWKVFDSSFPVPSGQIFWIGQFNDNREFEPGLIFIDEITGKFTDQMYICNKDLEDRGYFQPYTDRPAYYTLRYAVPAIPLYITYGIIWPGCEDKVNEYVNSQLPDNEEVNIEPIEPDAGEIDDTATSESTPNTDGLIGQVAVTDGALQFK